MTGRARTVAFAGTRGLPARYGGFESAIDEITSRLQGEDCRVVVFGRTPDRLRKELDELGREVVCVHGGTDRRSETFVASIFTGLYLMRRRKEFDFVFWFNVANLPGIFLTLLARVPMAVNVDGLEWRRAKWSLPFKIYYWISAFFVTRMCCPIIVDSLAIGRYYRRRFHSTSTYIPYGASRRLTVAADRSDEILAAYGVEKDKFFLQITRFEPDNLPLTFARSFVASDAVSRGFRLLIVGYSSSTEYADAVKATHGVGGVLVADAVFDPETLAVLRANCFCYLHGNTVGGTNPALLDAMTYSERILSIDNEFNREVLGDDSAFFAAEDLKDLFANAPEGIPHRHDAALAARLREYEWAGVSAAYLRLSAGLAAAYVPH